LGVDTVNNTPPNGLRELAFPFSAHLHKRLGQSVLEARGATQSAFADDLAATAGLLDPLHLDALAGLRDRIRRHVLQARAAGLSAIKDRLEASLDELDALIDLASP
jgi:hypothetical protein